MNTNGVISFDASFTSSYIRPLPLSGSNKIIAPYWANVDTSGTGEIFYRQTTDRSLLSRASSEIQAAFDMSQNVTITNIVIATWSGVGYSSLSRTNKVS